MSMNLIFAAALTISSALNLNTTNHTVTLPLHKQTIGATTAWYIVTDASDAAVAKKYGVNYAPSLADLGSAAIASLESRTAPDFSPNRTYVAGDGGFPPRSAIPGSTADAGYSPFVRIKGTAGVLNAPIVAVGDGNFDVTTHVNTEDRVVSIDTAKQTATLVLARGFFNGKKVTILARKPRQAFPRASSAPHSMRAWVKRPPQRRFRLV